MAKLKKRLLKGYLRNKYGRRQGKKLYKGIKSDLKREGIIGRRSKKR